MSNILEGIVQTCTKCGYEGVLLGPVYVRRSAPRMRVQEYLRWECARCSATYRTPTKEQEEARALETARRLLSKHNRWWRRLVRELDEKQLLTESDQRKQLWDYVTAFIHTNRITCAEGIYQQDNVMLNAQEFIEGLAEIVGYYSYEANEWRGTVADASK